MTSKGTLSNIIDTIPPQRSSQLSDSVLTPSDLSGRGRELAEVAVGLPERSWAGSWLRSQGHPTGAGESRSRRDKMWLTRRTEEVSKSCAAFALMEANISELRFEESALETVRMEPLLLPESLNRQCQCRGAALLPFPVIVM